MGSSHVHVRLSGLTWKTLEWAFKLRMKLKYLGFTLKCDPDLMSNSPAYHSNTASKLHFYQSTKENVQFQISIHMSVCSMVRLNVHYSLSSGLLSTALYFMGAPSALSWTSTNVKMEITCEKKKKGDHWN